MAVKLDIDAPEVEASILKALMADPSLCALVDDLFFEYHFHEPLATGWNFGWWFSPEAKRDAPNVDGAASTLRPRRADSRQRYDRNAPSHDALRPHCGGDAAAFDSGEDGDGAPLSRGGRAQN